MQFSWIFGSTLSEESLKSKHVVIIGGGYGGCELAAQLKKQGVPFTLIDPKDYFHHNVAALRAAVFPEWMAKSVIKYKETFGDNFVQGKVTQVDLEAKTVSIDTDHAPIEFTEVVFAVGSDGPFPGRPMANQVDTATQEYLGLSEAIEKANDIVIVGGGAVGVEIAGEIGDKYNYKKMTLIHPSEFLVHPDFGPKFQTNIKWALDRHRVRLLLGDRVENLADLSTGTCLKQTVKTKKGETIEADLVLKCTGLAPNTNLTKEIFGEDKFDDQKRLKVTDRLQVEGYTNVFAIGDCANTPEHKMAAHAANHAQLVVSNLIRELKGEPTKAYVSGSKFLKEIKKYESILLIFSMIFSLRWDGGDGRELCRCRAV